MEEGNSSTYWLAIMLYPLGIVPDVAPLGNWAFVHHIADPQLFLD